MDKIKKQKVLFIGLAIIFCVLFTFIIFNGRKYDQSRNQLLKYGLLSISFDDPPQYLIVDTTANYEFKGLIVMPFKSFADSSFRRKPECYSLLVAETRDSLFFRPGDIITIDDFDYTRMRGINIFYNATSVRQTWWIQQHRVKDLFELAQSQANDYIPKSKIELVFLTVGLEKAPRPIAGK